MKTLQLQDYQVSIGDIDTSLSSYLKANDYTQVVVIVDEHTSHDCLPLITDLLGDASIITISSGEQNKKLNTCETIWSSLVASDMDRHGLVINLGGGVIGDMGGFAASCYMRGIHFIQIPTTLLSQVDASVGGKLAVDFNGLKNFIGLFNNPQSVLVDASFLKTLPVHELRSGYAEMVKHALIKDAQIWDRLTSQADWKSNVTIEEITDSIRIKQDIVMSDPEEQGIRKTLNLGHTIGHAIETLSFETEKPYLHGEAIAIGMVAAAFLSVKYTGLRQVDCDRINTYLVTTYNDLETQILKRHQDILKILKRDKKNKGGICLFSLLTKIGACTYNINVNEQDIFDSLEYAKMAWQ